MNQFIFELKKIKGKRFLYLLVLVPLLSILLIFTYRFFTFVDFQEQESVKANQLLNDLNWRIAAYSRERGYYGPNQNQQDNPNELSEQDQTIFELLDEAERERFTYSVSAFYEEWSDLNIAKQKIWDNLIEVTGFGEELFSMSLADLAMEKYHIDWLVKYDVDTLDVATDQNSMFVLFNSFSWLFSLPAIILIIFFFSLAMFMEPKRATFNFTKVLPISYAKVMRHKLLLFFAMLASYILSIIVGSLILSLFDSIPLKGQLNYPMVVMTEVDTLVKPLWQVLSLQVLFFIGLTLLALVLICLFAQVFQNELFVTFIFAAVFLIGSQITRLSPLGSQTYNPFAWFDTVNFIQSQSTGSILLVLTVLFLSVIFLIWFVLLKDLSLPNWRRSVTYKGIEKLSKHFLLHFEWLKLHRQAILFYSTAIIVAFAIYLGVNSYQHHDLQVEQVQSDYAEDVQSYQASLADLYEEEEMFKEIVEDESVDEVTLEHFQQSLDYVQETIKTIEPKLAYLQDIEDEINNNQFNSLSLLELEQLEEDYLFVARTGEVEYSPIIPTNHAIFMPNAYINHQLSQWKEEHQIDFVPPGGPYYTLFIPSYQESPRSGDDEPPLGIDRGEFDQYLATVSQEHRYLSGLNLLADVFNQYFYLVILVLLAGFYSLSYVREWDGQKTIRYLLVQPIALTRVFIAKMKASIGMGFVFISLAFMIIFAVGSLLNGVGQVNFPFVQYIAQTLGRANAEQYLEIPMHMKYFQIVPLWQWLLMAGALLVSNILLINQLVYFLSTFSRNQWIVMGLALLTLSGGYLLTTIWPHDLLQFSPFQYLDIAKTLSGEVAVLNDYTWMNWWVGVISQLVLSLILTLIAVGRVRKE